MWEIFAVLVIVVLGAMLGLHLAKRKEMRDSAAIQAQRAVTPNLGKAVGSGWGREGKQEPAPRVVSQGRNADTGSSNSVLSSVMAYMLFGSSNSEARPEACGQAEGPGSCHHADSSSGQTCPVSDTDWTSSHLVSDNSNDQSCEVSDTGGTSSCSVSDNSSVRSCDVSDTGGTSSYSGSDNSSSASSSDWNP
jgi:hypothetical protein